MYQALFIEPSPSPKYLFLKLLIGALLTYNTTPQMALILDLSPYFLPCYLFPAIRSSITVSSPVHLYLFYFSILGKAFPPPSPLLDT